MMGISQSCGSRRVYTVNRVAINNNENTCLCLEVESLGTSRSTTVESYVRSVPNFLINCHLILRTKSKVHSLQLCMRNLHTSYLHQPFFSFV